ncbi:MAG TPA: hypothetical protein VFV34_02595 [Blastocatellia bacterium]|nr:hypothetical protein [Blastocatellia bacterium]
MSFAKRVAPFADKHKITWGGHGHSNVNDPEEFATPESIANIMSFSKYIGVNLDIGHFTAADFDAVAYIKEHHARITNIHLKDRKKNQGPNVPWGQGDNADQGGATANGEGEVRLSSQYRVRVSGARRLGSYHRDEQMRELQQNSSCITSVTG